MNAAVASVLASVVSLTPATSCPRCGIPTRDVQTSPRGQVFYGHDQDHWCIDGVTEEQVAA